MAKRKYTKRASTQIEGFAEDLGRVLGTATAKAESWLSERQQIVKNQTQVRDTASRLLADFGHQASAAGAAVTRGFQAKRRGRPVGSKNKTLVINKIRGAAEPVLRKRRKMSAKGRAAIASAQKARWAKIKAGEKKK